MTLSPELASLTRILDGKRSPAERLRVLARAWKQVHRLSPEDRYKLALRVGIEGLGEAIGELASREGVETPERLRDALAKLAATEPARARELLSAWRDPSRRAALLKHGLEAGIDALAGPPAAPGALPAAPPRRRTGTTQPIPVPAVRAALAGAPPAAPASPGAVPALALGLPTTGVPASAGPRPEPPAPVTPAATRAAEPSRAAPPVAAPSPHASPGAPAPPAPAAAPAAPAPPSAPRAALATDTPAAPPLVARFRQLRAELPSLVGQGAAVLGERLAAFPDGWPRRRALVQLIEAGLAAPRALALVTALGSRRDRLWCLRSLARQAPLDAALAGAALGEPLPASLARRLARA